MQRGKRGTIPHICHYQQGVPVCVWGCWSKEQNVWVLSGSCSHLSSPSKADGPVGREGEEGSEEWRGLSFHLSQLVTWPAA